MMRKYFSALSAWNFNAKMTTLKDRVCLSIEKHRKVLYYLSDGLFNQVCRVSLLGSTRAQKGLQS